MSLIEKFVNKDLISQMNGCRVSIVAKAGNVVASTGFTMAKAGNVVASTGFTMVKGKNVVVKEEFAMVKDEKAMVKDEEAMVKLPETITKSEKAVAGRLAVINYLKNPAAELLRQLTGTFRLTD